MSTQPFGAAPPPETPAPEPETPAKRSPLLLFGAPALAALLVAGGLSYVLLGGPADDDLATGVPPAAPAPSDLTPSPDPSVEAPRTLPLSASRNPFDPLVREPASSSLGSGPDAGSATGSGTGVTGATSGSTGSALGSSTSGSPPIISFGGGSGSGSGSTPGSGSGASGSGSAAPGVTAPGVTAPGSGQGPAADGSLGPVPPAANSLDAVATCKAGDDLWATYYKAMEQDLTITHTMAGNAIGPVTGGVDKLATATSVEELRQPLRSWARASASVRTQLVSGTAVRDVEPADPLKDASGGTPKPGVRPIVDQSSVLLARTAVRERCYQLTDPLVTKDSL